MRYQKYLCIAYWGGYRHIEVSIHRCITSNYEELTWEQKLAYLCYIISVLRRIHSCNDFHPAANILVNIDAFIAYFTDPADRKSKQEIYGFFLIGIKWKSIH